MSHWTSGAGRERALAIARRREAIEENIKRRRREHLEQSLRETGEAVSIEPLACPECGVEYVCVSRCPDCDELLVEACYLDLAREGRSSGAWIRPVALLVASALTIGGAALIYLLAT